MSPIVAPHGLHPLKETFVEEIRWEERNKGMEVFRNETGLCGTLPHNELVKARETQVGAEERPSFLLQKMLQTLVYLGFQLCPELSARSFGDFC